METETEERLKRVAEELMKKGQMKEASRLLRLLEELDENVKNGKTRVYMADCISIGIRAIKLLIFIFPSGILLFFLSLYLAEKWGLFVSSLEWWNILWRGVLWIMLLIGVIAFLSKFFYYSSQVFITYITTLDALEIKRPFGGKIKIYWDDVKSIEERKEYITVRWFCIFDDVAITLFTRQGKKVRFFLSAFGEYLYLDIKKRLEERGRTCKN